MVQQGVKTLQLSLKARAAGRQPLSLGVIIEGLQIHLVIGETGRVGDVGLQRAVQPRPPGGLFKAGDGETEVWVDAQHLIVGGHRILPTLGVFGGLDAGPQAVDAGAVAGVLALQHSRLHLCRLLVALAYGGGAAEGLGGGIELALLQQGVTAGHDSCELGVIQQPIHLFQPRLHGGMGGVEGGGGIQGLLGLVEVVVQSLILGLNQQGQHLIQHPGSGQTFAGARLVWV